MTIILDHMTPLNLQINVVAVQILLYLARIYSFNSKILTNRI